MLKQVAQVQQWLNNGEAESDLPPPKNMEELRAWLDQIKLSPDPVSYTHLTLPTKA